MRCTSVIFFLIFSLAAGTSYAQKKSEIESSSATDTKVRIHRGNRVRASVPQQEVKSRFSSKKSRAAAGPKEFKPRFNEKNKKAMTVSESSPRVYKTSKRMQRRNNKMRLAGKDRD